MTNYVTKKGYYKNWDGNAYQSNMLKIKFTNSAGDKIQLFFNILNHSLAIKWIQDLHEDLEEKKTVDFQDNTIVIDNSRSGTVSAYDCLCYNPNNYKDIITLKMKINQKQEEPLDDIYNISLFHRYSTSFTFDFGKSGKKSERKFTSTTINYNKSKQDRLLLDNLNKNDLYNVNAGQVYLGSFTFAKINDKIEDGTDLGLDYNDLQLHSLEIGYYRKERPNAW